jgi:rod shape-determining protein MreC
MRNLIRFLSKNSVVFLFLFLQFISFVLLVQNNSYQSSKIFNSSNFLIANLYATINNVDDYFNLKDVNAELAEQNARLKSASISSFTKVFGKTVSINDTTYFQKYVYTSAKIINNSTNKKNNYLTLDKGAINGVKAGMAVIAPKGVVGKVINVSEGFSSVMSVLHNKSKINGKIKKSGYFGPVIWGSGNNDYRYGQLKDIPNHVQLTVGDTIVTSGYSDDFPEGILIGTVKEFELSEGSNFYDIVIEFTVNYKTISYALFVKSLLKEEQKELEALNPENDK